jgi:quercetin dioxygenase-like cupin family protein
MTQKIIDVRGYPPYERHKIILEEFEKLKSGESLTIINDHEPVHLFHAMAHREDFDIDTYYAKEIEEGKWVAFLKKKETKPVEVIFTNIEKIKRFSENAFTPLQIHKTNTYSIVLTYFKQGQFIPIHTPTIDLVLFIYKGQGIVIAGENKYEVSEGDLIIVPKNVRRGVLAKTDMEALHFVSPPPSEKDHKEVEEGLKRNKFE